MYLNKTNLNQTIYLNEENEICNIVIIGRISDLNQLNAKILAIETANKTFFLSENFKISQKLNADIIQIESLKPIPVKDYVKFIDKGVFSEIIIFEAIIK